MRLCLFSFLFLFLLCPASNNVRQHEMSFNVGSPRNIPPTPSIRGTIVKEDQILLVKIGKCMGFCMYRRSYVLWSLVIVEGTRPRDDLNKQTKKLLLYLVPGTHSIAVYFEVHLLYTSVFFHRSKYEVSHHACKNIFLGGKFSISLSQLTFFNSNLEY